MVVKSIMITAAIFICFLASTRRVGAFSTPRNFLTRSASHGSTKSRLLEKVADVAVDVTVADDEIRELLNKRKAVEMNPTTSHLKSALPGIMETELYPEKGTIVFSKGERSNGLYFVQAGIFECVDDDGTVVAKVEQGEVFGELGIFLAEPRALTVRSGTSDASLWFVDAKRYKLLTQMIGGEDVSYLQNSLEGDYKEYMDFREKRKALSSFKAFRKKMTKDEIDIVAHTLKRQSFEPGEDVVIQGSETDPATMYFLDRGTFEVYDADKGMVIKTYNSTTGYFGELAFFLDRPRARSIRASSPGTLFLLSRKDLFNVVDEDIFEEEFLSLLADQYRDAGLLDKYDQVMEYLELKSRPKKKSVSLHSTVSIVASGSFVTAYQPFFHPGFDKDGFVRFFDFYQPLTIDTCHQIQLSVGLLAVSGVMGYFRIPPNTPAARRLPFTLASLANVFFALVLTSSLNALPEGYWFFDAFSDVGTASIGLAYFIEAFFLITAFENSISGSEAGLDSTPGGMGRASNIFFAALIYFFVNTAQVPLVLPIFFSDIASYQGSMSAAFEAVGMPSLDFHSFATAVGFVSFLQLVATLQFEKKISEIAGLVSFVTLFVVFNGDAITATYKTVFRPQLLPIIENTNNYLPNLIAQNHIAELGLGITGLVIVNAIRKAIVMNEKSSPALK
jgi:CRP-like cAMP-binding protein